MKHLLNAPARGAAAATSQNERAEAAGPSEQQTSASFGDWAVRCERRPGAPKRVCEAAQALVIEGQQATAAP